MMEMFFKACEQFPSQWTRGRNGALYLSQSVCFAYCNLYCPESRGAIFSYPGFHQLCLPSASAKV